MGVFLANRDAPSRCTATECLVRFCTAVASGHLLLATCNFLEPIEGCCKLTLDFLGLILL